MLKILDEVPPPLPLSSSNIKLSKQKWVRGMKTERWGGQLLILFIKATLT